MCEWYVKILPHPPVKKIEHMDHGFSSQMSTAKAAAEAGPAGHRSCNSSSSRCRKIRECMDFVVYRYNLCGKLLCQLESCFYFHRFISFIKN